MAAGDTGWFRGEGGSIIEMDLPLPEAIEARHQAGLILRVNADGTPWADAPAEPADVEVSVKPAVRKTRTTTKPAR